MEQTGEKGRLWGREPGDSPVCTRHVSYSKVRHHGWNRKKYRKWIEATFKEIMAKDFRILKKNLCPQIEAQGN